MTMHMLDYPSHRIIGQLVAQHDDINHLVGDRHMWKLAKEILNNVDISKRNIKQQINIVS